MEMGKKIYVDFPESKIRVVADLCEETEPEMCEILWNTIKDQPLRMACMHTMSTGHFFDAKIRPSASPVKSGTQANPVGRHKWFLCDLKPRSDALHTERDVRRLRRSCYRASSGFWYRCRSGPGVLSRGLQEGRRFRLEFSVHHPHTVDHGRKPQGGLRNEQTLERR